MSEVKKKRGLSPSRKTTSGLSQFVERPIPTEREVASFEKVIRKKARNKEIETNLSEIYRDKRGGMINVQKMNVKKRQVFFVRLLRRLLIWGIIFAAAYFAWMYFFEQGNDSSAMELAIIAPEEIVAGEEFSYSIEYFNPSKFSLSGMNLEMQYPENFVFVGSSLVPQSGNYGWNLPDLEAGERATLSIVGKLISQPKAVNVISARLSYMPQNFSSNFKKEASSSTTVSALGFRVVLEKNNTAFIGQENEASITFSNIENNYLGDFNLIFDVPDGVEVTIDTSGEAKKGVRVIEKRDFSWQINGLNKELDRQKIPFSFTITGDMEQLSMKVRLEKKMDDGQAYTFWEDIINPDLVKSDLNLTLFLNGSRNDQTASFGQTLNYTLSYSNQGDSAFKDVVILAILDGDFLDWSSVSNNKGEVINDSIIWTKKEIADLAEIGPGEEGEINFSINLKEFQDDNFGENLEVTSYAQYGFNNKPSKDENKSNSIVSIINSDLNLKEELRYFDDNNRPVGSGPLPPKVDEKTGFRVYWTITNNLHELNNVNVVANLPAHVSWDNNENIDAGALRYDSSSHQVIWEVGRMPVSVYKIDANFGVSITPASSDLNKIMVLSSGSTITATDIETKDTITKTTSPKTTKLEDDEVARLNNSGRVE